ncbi:preprotein translocase subunit SecE [Ectothiorhodospira haloalkaliphila]|uniref:Protein translocase subunit SecE n=1 Tax=Ectothiorhodospira haloalkaliphila TaxID=421628 RepID=W8KRY1_9GAMM|nr:MULTISPECIES: preprotein translocase subunit SecE [Ectothiorhodospira]AHK79757.1 preprotein translocase subunit SecE [Ectothiorhodospira haloalkaliphila]MCG5495373.1 preprotein translocase subunit SecE [Ectothiorhodospira variabilis]MCG5498782.1 preprotein translocase subunit SecE [Ectothiorhodospira variabilis]MCG5504971.1 preprotein translocase subunit SecE [Ectothiorhodospira variabilis]MCG5508128.1 preprotein translocase subunit SecE [Ectothiorhodospira variabilis]
MAGKAEEVEGAGFDTVKLLAAVGLLVAGVTGFYWFADQSTLLRVLGLLAFAAVSVGIIFTTAKGRTLAAFLTDARTEVRKMVWPSRTETLQTALVVIAITILVAIFLWLIDMLLGWSIREFIR